MNKMTSWTTSLFKEVFKFDPIRWIFVLLRQPHLSHIQISHSATREPDQVVLNTKDYQNMSSYTSHMFAWGNKPGILVKKPDGFEAFSAICTHLDCTVSFLSKEKMFYCSCHNGWYDENGVNVAGPPPSPLKRLGHRIEDGQLIIFKEKMENKTAMHKG